MAGEGTELATLRRHVREGESYVRWQREVVAGMESRGTPTGVAVALLGEFEQALLQHKGRLARVEAEGSRVARRSGVPLTNLLRAAPGA